MAVKPSALPRWATSPDAGGIVEPAETNGDNAYASKDKGWKVGKTPPAPWMNWLFNLIHQWLAYVDDLHNQDFNGSTKWTKFHRFEDSISVGATTGSTAIAANAIGDGNGIEATGAGTGSGALFVAGNTNGIGVQSFGRGTGSGAQIEGGSNGIGARIGAGGGNNIGADIYASGTSPALRINAGINFNGTQPAYNADPGANIAHAPAIPKAWAVIQLNGIGGCTVGSDSFNIDDASIVITSTYVEVYWKRAFTTANYAVVVTGEFTGSQFIVASFNKGSQTTTKARIHFRDLIGGAVIDPSSTVFFFTISANGRH